MELKTIGLTKKFGSKTAVDDLNITLTNGVYGLLGANGAGKTTLMRLLCNIQNPTSGKILLNGKNIVGLGERYRNLLGYLPQHFGYYPDFSAFDFLLYISALKGLDEKAARKKSKELLEAVDLSRESKHKIKTFSGGMKQRLSLARAFLRTPKLYVFDEITANLDKDATNCVLTNIESYAKKIGAGIVYISHDQKVVDRCDKVITLENKLRKNSEEKEVCRYERFCG